MYKTCGKCANYDYDKKECVYTQFSTGEEVHEHHNPNDKACEDWMECADTLEQRYAQLEQVAREMLTEYGDTAHALCVLNPGRSNGKTLLAKLSHEMSIDYRKFRDQLEALGVVCDD